MTQSTLTHVSVLFDTHTIFYDIAIFRSSELAPKHHSTNQSIIIPYEIKTK